MITRKEAFSMVNNDFKIGVSLLFAHVIIGFAIITKGLCYIGSVVSKLVS